MSKSEIYIGIDPGAKGAIAVLEDNKLVKQIAYNENIAKDIKHLNDNFEIAHCCLEKVSAMPGQGVTSMFSFGTNYGFYLGVLAALGIPHSLVSPKEWQKGYTLPADKKARKITIAKIAQRAYPNGVFYSPRNALLDGMADSCLIAQYCYQKYYKGNQ